MIAGKVIQIGLKITNSQIFRQRQAVTDTPTPTPTHTHKDLKQAIFFKNQKILELWK